MRTRLWGPILILGWFFICSFQAAAADLNVYPPLETKYYQADGAISAQGSCVVSAGKHVRFLAGGGIALKPGFRVEAGGSFAAIIGTIADIPPLADIDGDALGDRWELLTFGNLSRGPTDHDDADGYSNYEEYNLGTDPRNSNSRPDPDQYDEGVDFGIAAADSQGGDGIIGKSVNILNGNAVEARDDLRFPSPHLMGLGFKAYYNSRSARSTELGYGWTHTYSVALETNFGTGSGNFIRIVDETGRVHYFLNNRAGLFAGYFNEKTDVVMEVGEYVWNRRDGRRFRFARSGKLIRIDDEAGNQLNLAYDGQIRLASVSDSATGRSLAFYYNATGLFAYISGPASAAVVNGRWINSFGYDGNRNLTSVVYADGTGFDYYYTDTGIHNLTEKRNKASHQLNTWSYDSQDRCTGMSERGSPIAISYATATRVDVTDAYGVVRSYAIGEFGGQKRLTTMTGLAGASYLSGHHIKRWAFDDELNLIETETVRGTITKWQNHNERGNPATVILAYGSPEERVISYAYHPDLDLPLTRTEGSVLGTGSKTTTWDFDDDGDSISNEDPTGLVYRLVEQGFTKNAAGQSVAYEYVTKFSRNLDGQVTAIDGPLAGSGDATGFNYDPATGDLTGVTRPIIGTAQYGSYDAAGQVGRITDVNGRAEIFSYDGRGRVGAINHQADGGLRSISYNNTGVPYAIADEDGVERVFYYDSVYGRLETQVDMDGNFIHYLYDVRGNPVERSVWNAAGSANSSRKRWYYQAHVDFSGQPDIPGLLWKMRIGSRNAYTYGYDADGNVSAVTDPEGNQTSYQYDALGRLTKLIQPGGIETRYGYDAHGNLASLTDGRGNSTSFSHDDLGRVVAAVSPDTGTTAYAYDEAGNLTRKKDANNISVEYQYDSLYRLTAIQFPDPAQNITFIYDQGPNGIGRRTGMADASGASRFGYDSRGRWVLKQSTLNALDYTTERVFTPGGRLASFTYPQGYRYNNIPPLPSRRIVDFERYTNINEDNYRKLKKVSTAYEGGTVTIWDHLAYDPFGSSRAIATGSGNQVTNSSGPCGCLESANAGRQMEQLYQYDQRGNLTEIHATNMPWLDQAFSYDALNRLKTAQGSYGSIAYAYDAVGNLLSRTSGGQVESFSYQPGSNRLAGFGYDNNGNLTQDGARSFTYNQDNRLIRVQEGATVKGEYTYNGLGQRVKKTAGASQTLYHYDFDGNLIGESESNGYFLRHFVYVNGNRAVMFYTNQSQPYYYNNNYLGTPVFITDSANKVVWGADYEPYGKATIHPSSTVENHFRFPGQYFDAETGLHYNWHRYYDPKTGRYVTPDPLGLRSGINLFAYAHNNPIRLSDPVGLAVFAECTYTSGGEIVGGGILECSLTETNCTGRKKEKGKYLGIFAGVSAGAPVGRTHFFAPFEKVDDVRDLEGRASFVSVSSAIIVGVSWGQVCLGQDCSYGWTKQLGLDLSADFFVGYGFVYDISEECCAKEK